MDLIDKESLLHRQVKILSGDEQEELFLEAQKGNVEARNVLIMHNIPYVIKIVNEHWTKHSLRFKHLEFEDLLQIGVFGIEHAIRKFDIARVKSKNGFRPMFLTCCSLWIRHYLDDWANQYKSFRIPRSVQWLYDKGRLEKPSQALTKRSVRFFRECSRLSPKYDKVEEELAPLDKMAMLEELEKDKKIDPHLNVRLSV